MIGGRWTRAAENGYIAPDPLNPSVVFGGNSGAAGFSGDEEVQELPPTLAHPGKYRSTWTLARLFFSADRSACAVFRFARVLFRTADGGSSWQVISPDLTRERPRCAAQSGSRDGRGCAEKTNVTGVIYAIAPSFVKEGEIWAGTDDGLIQLTQDEGKTWENVTPPELTPWSKVDAH